MRGAQTEECVVCPPKLGRDPIWPPFCSNSPPGITTMSCERSYIYIDEIPNILGTNMGECIEKKQFRSEAIGEWYICEIYEFESGEKTRPAHNDLYRNNISWSTQDWSKLPIDSNSRINDIVFINMETDKSRALYKEMTKINSLGCGYYSFCAKPSINDPVDSTS